ncbi:MAG: hypothetical protein R3342_05640 [Lutibacter sp.]|uniref:hypothetical protein n=1 Tax=Lutibacter sp. TaxID=1925666 RepID=UPI00299DBA37|nr:hypothetical protein [Lutibacter sp.]MDX1829012.1 hypothetical protein [Lutibacter sp.]
MEKEVIYNSDLYFEHKQWRRELFFWEDELKSFKNRLNEIANRWTDKNVLAELEHFQNQFINQAEVIDKMQHDINVHENKIVENTKEGEDILDLNLSRKHIEFRNSMETQRHIYGDLKKEFFRFLSKYL